MTFSSRSEPWSVWVEDIEGLREDTEICELWLTGRIMSQQRFPLHRVDRCMRYDIFCKAAYSSLKEKSSSIVSAKNWADALDAAVSAVSKYGGASTGFRTMLDALIPAAACLQEKLNLGEDAERAFLSAAKAAYEGAESTVRMQAQVHSNSKS
ncbi:hypothetical protein L7F22_001659 [Adiantum nelumboides]|nr:hypothetical protein [Adiantum nelumboides]